MGKSHVCLPRRITQKFAPGGSPATRGVTKPIPFRVFAQSKLEFSSKLDQPCFIDLRRTRMRSIEQGRFLGYDKGSYQNGPFH